MPRTASTEVAVKLTLGQKLSTVSSWMTSAEWRWPVGLKERTMPDRSGWWLAGPDSPPAPDDPDLASTTIGMAGSSRPALASGQRARIEAVALQPGLAM